MKIQDQLVEKKLKNLDFLYNEKKSAFPLTIEFLENKYPKFSEIIPKEIQIKLNFIKKFIEDYDLYLLEYEETEPLILAIFESKIELNANKNKNLFSILLNIDIKSYIEFGKELIIKSNLLIENVLEKKEKITIPLNDKKKINGYALCFGSFSFNSFVANKLAKKSLLL